MTLGERVRDTFTQPLICTKTRRRYERRCKEYRRDVAALATLADLAAAGRQEARGRQGGAPAETTPLLPAEQRGGTRTGTVRVLASCPCQRTYVFEIPTMRRAQILFARGL